MTTDRETGNTYPITKQTAAELAHAPKIRGDSGETVDKNLWLYELCRFLTMKANNLITAFFRERPQCSAATCPEMRASEWQYLCAVHDPPKSCCAIDYCCHTLDWATNILTSPKLFPSRMVLGGDNGNTAAAMRQLTNIFRRVYRIFAHAWFQHRDVFWTVEGNDGLYIFFKTVCDVYQLIPEDNYTIPPEAEGERDDADETPVKTTAPELMHLLKKDPSENTSPHADSDVNTTVSVGATTRRHKHTPSTGSHVTTIAEGPEEEEPSADTTTVLSSSSPEKPPTEIDLTNSMDKMNLNSLPAFEGKAPEDPTPTAHSEGHNPFDDEAANSIEEPLKDQDHVNDDKDDLEKTIEHLESFADTPADEDSGVETVIEADEKRDEGKPDEAEEKSAEEEVKTDAEDTTDAAPAGVV